MKKILSLRSKSDPPAARKKVSLASQARLEGSLRVECSRRGLAFVGLIRLVTSAALRYSALSSTHIKLWKLLQYHIQPLLKRILRKFNLPHIKMPDPRNLIARVDHRGRLSLQLRQGDVDELRRGRDHGDGFEVVEGRHVETGVGFTRRR